MRVNMAGATETRIKLTYEDYALFPDNGMIHELIDGEHYMTPAPETYHQKISRRIQFQLYVQVEEKDFGQVINAPVDVQLSSYDIVQPDLIIVLKQHETLISPKKVLGPPDLVVEITSESSRSKDRTLKYNLYEKAGVPEYWLVDMENHEVQKYRLYESRFRLAGSHRQEISFDGLSGVRVDLGLVW